MKIITYSDLHLEFGTEFRPPLDSDADLMILAGASIKKAARWRYIMLQHAQNIQNAELDYDLNIDPMQNSNSVVASVLHSVGINISDFVPTNTVLGEVPGATNLLDFGTNLDGIGTSSDSIFGGTMNDTLSGGAGNDYLDCGDEHDLLDGGEGNDVIVGSAGNDIIDGGDGEDILDVNFFGANATVNLTSDTSGTITNGTSTTTFSNIELFYTFTPLSYVGSSDGDVITGTEGADSISGNGGGDNLTGGDGGDTKFPIPSNDNQSSEIPQEQQILPVAA